VNSLGRQTYTDFELIIADNASSDGSMEALDTQQIKDCQIILNDGNLGYAQGNNEATQRARGEWLVFLNPDTVVNPDWLAEVNAGLKRHPGVAMFGCAQFDLAATDLLDGVGDAYLAFGFPWRGGFGHNVASLPDEGECFSPCGASAIIRADKMALHGGFDERFFCYCEDVDLGFRMRLAGERCIFLPKAIVKHAGSGISGRHSDFAVYHGTRNRLWTYAKNMPWPLLAVTLPVNMVLTVYLLVRSFSGGTTHPMWRGLRDGVKGLRMIRQPSRWSPQRRIIPLSVLARAMAWNPWRMSRRAPHIREAAALLPERATAEA